MADVVIAIARVSANTVTGDQDITSGDLGGLTPKAVLFFYNNAIVDGVSVDASGGIGAATSATERWTQYASSQDGESITQVNRHVTDDAVIKFLDIGTSSVDGEADFVTFITNGVRINWSNAPSAAFKITAVFFGGADVADAFAGNHLGTPDLVITDPGFTANLIFVGANDKGVAESPSTSAMQQGFGWQDGQATPDRQGHGFAEDNNVAAGEPVGRRDTAEAFVVVDEGAGTIDYAGHYDTFTASGFTYRAANSDSDSVVYLALRITNGAVKIAAIDSPTSTGDWVVTGIGFKPELVLIGLNLFTVVNSARTGAEAGSIGYSIFTEDVEASVSFQVEDGAATTDTQSTTRPKAIALPFDDGSAGFAADFVTMDSDGWTLDMLNVSGTVRKWFYLAIEGGAVDAQGQVSFAEFEIPDEAGQGQVSFAEFETPDEAGQGQVSFAELEVPTPTQGQVSWAEFEVPSVAQGQVSFAEFETPHPPTQGQISWAELEVPTQQISPRAQISFGELELPEFGGDSRGQWGFAQFEVPDVVPGQKMIISFAEFKTSDVNAGGDGDGQVSFTEFEVPDAESLMISSMQLEVPDPRRVGRVAWARVEFASVPGPNRQEKIVLQDINRNLFLEELDVYGIKPDVGFFLPGFDPLDEPVVEGETDPNFIDPQRVWTPKLEITQQFGENVEPGEMWLDYSFVLTEEDLFHILLVCNQHDPTKTTEDQDIQDQFFEDLRILRDYATRCGPNGSPQLTDAEKDDCHCRLLRFVLRLATETTVRRIQDDPFTDEPFDLGFQ